MLLSQVEAVGRHWQFALQKYLNLTIILSGNPKGGTCSKPVMNFNIWLTLTVPVSPVEIKKYLYIYIYNQKQG